MAEILKDTLKRRKYCPRLAAVQRIREMRIASSYCTVSETAVVAGVVSIYPMTAEQKAIFTLSKVICREKAAKRVGVVTMAKW